jgi:hypothetical protein
MRESRREYQARRRAECHRHVLAHLEAHPCVDCGERDVAVLQFDHVRGSKVKAVAVLLSHSLRAVEAEIAKCEVRCGNCHRRKTIRERGHWLLKYARSEDAP